MSELLEVKIAKLENELMWIKKLLGVLLFTNLGQLGATIVW
tara:strand:+ start:537 stop:659 length:123 start_codon:yes stop_codon:yes gene_type:complete